MRSKKFINYYNFSSAFTIVELLVVIVIIGILAAITIVSYVGVSNKANESSVISDLDNNAKLLKLYYSSYDSYPTALDSNNCPTAPTIDNKHCLKLSGNNTLVSYTSIVKSDFRLTIKNNNMEYSINSTTSPAITTTPSNSTIGKACPTGFIPVPGSGTYGTDDFCVMKYEAKIYGNDNGTTGYSSTNYPSSRASGTPYVNISQTNAITQSEKTVDQSGNTITGAHLITESEWMTIAQNVLSVASNWSSGTVGTGYIYSGHNDNNPANALVASTDDSDGYYGTGNTSGNQKRTLSLTNGEVIWDLAGDVWEWTSGQTTGGQPGISGGDYAWRDYTAITTTGSLSVNIFPSSTGISGSSSWTSSNGIGQIYSSADETAARAFRRGGTWNTGGCAGVLALDLHLSPSTTSTYIGLRVSR